VKYTFNILQVSEILGILGHKNDRWESEFVKILQLDQFTQHIPRHPIPRFVMS